MAAQQAAGRQPFSRNAMLLGPVKKQALPGFPAELDSKVDMAKINLEVMKPWIATRITELLSGVEDEVLIGMVYNLLTEGPHPSGKDMYAGLLSFLEQHTATFMRELWAHFKSAEANALPGVPGIPQFLLDAKREELQKRDAATQRMHGFRHDALPPPPPPPTGVSLPPPPPPAVLPSSHGRRERSPPPSRRWDDRPRYDRRRSPDRRDRGRRYDRRSRSRDRSRDRHRRERSRERSPARSDSNDDSDRSRRERRKERRKEKKRKHKSSRKHRESDSRSRSRSRSRSDGQPAAGDGVAKERDDVAAPDATEMEIAGCEREP